MEAMQEEAVQGPAGEPVEVTPIQEQAPVPEFSGKPEDFQRDMQMLAQEQGAVPPAQVQEQPQTQPQEPEQPATAPVTPKAVEKFQNPDGSLNTEKVIKSTAEAQATLQKYLETERELKRKMNEVRNLERQAPAQFQQAQPQQVPVQVPPQVPASFEGMVMQDLASQGIDPKAAQSLAPVLVKLFNAAHQTALEQALQDNAKIREESEMSRRQRELESLAEHDPWVLSPQGFETLNQIRQSKPWINQSLTPVADAYEVYLGMQAKQQRLSGKVQTPNPTAPTVRAPAAPVAASQRVATQPQVPNFSNMSQDQITAYAASLGPEGEKKFWASRGLRF